MCLYLFRLNRGLSLIELLVSLLLSSLVMLAVSHVVLAHLKLDVLLRDLVYSQENGRFALYVLKRDLQLAGFGQREGLFSMPIDWSLTKDGQKKSLGKDNDVLVLKRLGFAGDFNCHGSPVLEGEIVESHYSVSKGNLYCKPVYYRLDKNGLAEKVTASKQAIVDRVENFQVRFAVYDVEETFSLNEPIPDHAVVDAYLNADEVNPMRHRVLGVQFGLIIKSDRKQLKNMDVIQNKNPIQLLDRTYENPKDNQMRQVVTHWVMLRNVHRYRVLDDFEHICESC